MLNHGLANLQTFILNLCYFWLSITDILVKITQYWNFSDKLFLPTFFILFPYFIDHWKVAISFCFIYDFIFIQIIHKIPFKPLRANPAKWSNTLKQFVGKLPTNCLSVFEHFVGLALKGLNDGCWLRFWH